jgi:uncharacterized membrane protein
MNLDLSPLGWGHLLASLVAIAIGAAVLVRPKGTAVHRARGRIYAVAILATSLTALGIYRLGVFFFAHWFAVAALIVTAAGVAAAHFRQPRAGWINLHLTCMVASFYILIGGAVNEVFLRVNFLRDFHSPLAVGLTHSAILLLFAALIGYFNAAALLRARTARRISSNGQAAQHAQKSTTMAVAGRSWPGLSRLFR